MQKMMLAIEQGTTVTKAVLYNTAFEVMATSQQTVEPEFQVPDRCEQDPEAIWQAVCTTSREVLDKAGVTVHALDGLSLTNQRETFVVWQRSTGQPVYPAITWQDRRTEALCSQWRQEGREILVQGKTGLILDPYFSGTKLHWLLKHVEPANALAEQGDLCFGTIDSFLLWRLTGGRLHATDATNASRTLLFNIHEQTWDDELLSLMQIPRAILPEVRDSSADFGVTDDAFLGSPVPVLGVIGDQQAALVGQACLTPGAAKATYGSGCFALVNTGDKPVTSQNRLLTTVAYRLHGKPCYAVEGNIFMAGAVVQWLRDDLNIIRDVQDVETLVQAVPLEQSEVMVPAFTGIGAPYWDHQAKGAIFGLTRNTQSSHLVAAALRSIAFQTEDLLKAMRFDDVMIDQLKVDGGMLTNQWFLQTLSDVTGTDVLTCTHADAAARGSALLAALQCGWIDALPALADYWEAGQHFRPGISDATRDQALRRWDEALMRIQAPL